VPAGNDVPSVAITGYTNAGKPALLNRLAGSDVLVEGKLFATLDPTVRWVVNQGCTYTLTDTVGSMRNLPHQLVDAFRSTLEEVVHADLALHVVDASAPDAMAQVTTVRGVPHEVGAFQLPELLVVNKVDIGPAEWVDALQRATPTRLPSPPRPAPACRSCARPWSPAFATWGRAGSRQRGPAWAGVPRQGCAPG
jgi:GTPase